MADQQIEDLTELTSGNLVDADLFIVNDVSNTTNDAGGEPLKILASSVQTYVLAGYTGGSGIVTVGTVTTGTWSADLAADTVDAITEIAAALKSGSDTTLVTGTAGSDTEVAYWNADGDLVSDSDLTWNTSNGRLKLVHTGAAQITSVLLQQSTGGTDEKVGGIWVDSLGNLILGLYNDAISGRNTGLSIGRSGNTVTKITIRAPLLIQEASAAVADVAGQGQIWVKSDTPNTLYFTDDAGTDFQLATLTGTETFTNKTLTTPAVTTPTLTGDLIFNERADHASTPGAGKGYLWTKSTTPSTLIFTNDAGTDTTLGSGGVDTSGTPADSQIAIFTDADTVEGDADFTFDTSTNTFALAGAADTSIMSVGGANVLVDSPRGTLTLSNVDALDATTEATIEAAIDTLANLTAASSLATVGTITSGTWQATIGASTLAGTLSRAADQTIDLTGAATRTLTLQNSTASQVANFDVDGQLVFRGGHATGTFTTAGTPTAARTVTFGDRNVDFSSGGTFAENSHTHTESDISDLGTTVAMVADNLSVFAATTSAQLAGVISDETGSGALVFATSPALTTPNIGTPSAGTLTNCDGYPGDSNLATTGTVTSGTWQATIGASTLAGTLSRAADQTIDLTGAATRTLTLQNSTASQVANFDVDGQFVWRGGHATGTFTTVGTPTAARTVTFGDRNVDFSSGGTFAENSHTHTESDISDLGTTVAMVADNLSVFAATTSAQLAGVISDETGSGALVFATSPALTTPNIGTPSAGTLTSCTGLPISTGVSGLGANVATFLATPSSANLASAVTDETGSGALMFGTSPAISTPTVTGDIVFNERADHASTPGAGKGYLWTKNTTPSSLIFTDDAGTDTTLGSGSGDVSKVGTPVDSQVGVWTGDGTIEGDADLTFDTSTNTLAVAPAADTSIVSVGAVNILVDSPRGTMTLSNVDALDATTEATIEAAIDTLGNLTSASALATVGTVTSGTWSADLSTPTLTGDLVINERADHASTPGAGKGYVWVKNTAPSTLIFTDDAGTDTTLSSGSGDVSKVGTPVDSQIGVWTGDGTIEGDADLTFDTSTNTLALAPAADTSIMSVGGANILVDSPRGTMTLSNIDALDATTETTIEAAIDTLSNLTSVGTIATGTWSADLSTPTLTGDLVINERADHASTPGAGKGYVWCKNTAPSTLIFTDDGGTDTTLGSGGGGLTHQTVESGGDVTPSDLTPTAGTNFSATKDNFYWVDVPYCNTLDTTDGNCRVDLPGAPTAGDRLGVGVKVDATDAGAFAQAPGFCVELNPGATPINGATYTEKNSGGGEKWSLWLDGECLILQYVDSTIGWVVEYDGRIAHHCRLRLNADQTGIVSGSVTVVQCATNVLDQGGLRDTGNYRIRIKRANSYIVSGVAYWDYIVTAHISRAITILEEQTDGTFAQAEMSDAAIGDAPAPWAFCIFSFDAADSIRLKCYQDSGYNQTMFGGAANEYATFAAWEKL